MSLALASVSSPLGCLDRDPWLGTTAAVGILTRLLTQLPGFHCDSQNKSRYPSLQALSVLTPRSSLQALQQNLSPSHSLVAVLRRKLWRLQRAGSTFQGKKNNLRRRLCRSSLPVCQSRGLPFRRVDGSRSEQPRRRLRSPAGVATL